MWKKVRRTIRVPPWETNPKFIDVLERDGVVREDGVSITQSRGASRGSFLMLYQDRDTSFEFSTQFMTDPEGGTPLDAWIIHLGLALDFVEFTGKSITPEKAKEIADNIESGLLAWPDWGPKKVKFRMSYWKRWSPSWGWGER